MAVLQGAGRAVYYGVCWLPKLLLDVCGLSGVWFNDTWMLCCCAQLCTTPRAVVMVVLVPVLVNVKRLSSEGGWARLMSVYIIYCDSREGGRAELG